MASVAFRLTIYQANGTTPDLTVTSVRGGTNPYIVDVPSGDGQEVDLLTGAVRSGAYNVRVADVVTGSTGTGTVRLVTAKLEDADYRQHLLSRRATLECSRNGGSTWAIWTSGYLTALRQIDAMTYEFTVSDSRRLESTHTAFTWWSDTNKTTDERREFPNRGCLMGGPLIENFGPIRASGGWEFRWREVQSGYLALAFTAAYDPPAYQRSQYFNPAKFRADARTFLRRLPPVASLTGTNFEQLRDREFVWGYPELLAAVTDGTTTWYGSVRAAFTPVNYSGSGAGDRNLGPDVERSNFIFVELDPNQSTSYPSSNAKVRVRILQREVSEISPIYIDEHPVDIAVKLYKTVGIPYNSSSVTSTKAAVGDDVRLALRIGEPVNMGEFLSNAIFGPFGFSARTNSSGEQEFFPTRIANATAPTTTIAVNDIVGDAPPPVFEVDENTVVTSFRLTAQALTQFVPDSDNKVEPPSDGLVAIENTQVVQNADTTTFSTREVAYEIPGMVHDGSASGAAFVLSPEVVGRFFTGIVAEGFDRFGRGAIVSEVQVLAGSTAANLQVGDEVVLNIPYYPNKNYRIGESTVGTRIAQIVRRTEMPEGPIFKLVDSGVNQQPTSPTFTIASWTGDPRRVAQVTVTNATTLNTAQVTLAVQYQVSANTPTKTGTLFTRFRPGTIPTSAFLLPTVPPGSKVWVRMRTEKTELRASAWTSWTSVTLDSWTAPTSLAAGTTTANSVSLSWSLAGNTLDPMDVFAYPGASAPADWTPYRITTLSAGSTTTIVRDLNPSTQYTFGVAFKDIGTGAYSGFTTVTASTNAVNTSTCPAAPKMKVITSFDTAGSTTGVVLSLGAIEGYNVVVQRAPNVAGSPGTWADIAVLAPLTGYYADILPSDGVTRWYRVFYRLSGFLDGAPGTARSAVPVAIPDDLILTEGPSIISGGSSLSFGNYLTGTPDSFYDGSTAQSVAVDATSANTANKVVARDNTGSFSANVVTATLDGPAPAGQLTGTTLASNVVTSSLTSVGTIGTGVWQGTSVGKNYGGTGLTSTAFTGITNERVFAYDGGSGTFFVAPSGSNGQALVYSGGALAWGNPAPGSHVLADTTGLGSQHTTSGLTAGMILQATGATTARFQTPSIPASSVTAGTFSGASYTITNDFTVSGTLTGTLTGNITGNAATVTNGVYTTGSYADPSWITSLSGTKISGNISGNAANVTGTVAIANGGTNATSYGTSGSGTRAIVYDIGTNAFEAVSAGTSGQFLQSAGSAGDILWATPPNFSTTTTTAGYVPGSNGVGTSYFLRADGSWAIPSVGSISANNVTAGTFAGASYTFSNSVTFTSGVRVANGETYKILNSGGTAVDVLSATTLGTGVVNSSLTSVGTLTSGAIGTGFTAIANSALANSSITINGTAVSLGGSITLPLTQWTTSGSDIYYNSGNVTVGTTSVAGWRLFVRGAGTTNATYAFGAENSAQTALFTVRNDGAVAIPNGQLTISGNTALHAGNYSSYALPLGGGTLTGVVNTSAASQTINTTTPGTGTYQLNFIGQATTDYAQAITWGWSSSGAQAGVYVQSSGSYGTKMYLATTDSFAVGAKTAISIDHLGNTNIVRGALTQGGNQVVHAGNVSSYALPITGGTVTGVIRVTATGGFSIGEDAGQNRIRTISGSRFAFYNSSDVLTGLAIRSLGVGATYGTIATPTNGAIIEGDVGIGSSSPGNFNGLTFASPILDVSGSINIRGVAGNGVAALQMGGDTYRKAVIYTPISTSTPYLAFGVGTSGTSSSASEFMRIDSSGNVGIGTTSPVQLLHVANGNVFITKNYGITWNNGDNYIKGVDGYALQFTTYDGGSGYNEVLRLTGGSIGAGGGATALFGTTTASTVGGFTNTRVVIKQIADGGTGGGLHIEQNSNTNVAYFGFTGSSFRIGTSYRSTGSYQPIDFYTGPTTASSMILSTSGNLGIGTASPSEKLHVAGNGIFNGYVIFKDSINSNTYGIRGLSGIITADGGGQYPTGWNFQYGGSSSSALYINSSGNVGIGTTSPNVRLHLGSTTYTNPNGTYQHILAGGWGVLWRENFDSYILGNAFYNSSGQWISTYGGFGGNVLSIVDGEYHFHAADTVAAGSPYTLRRTVTFTKAGSVGIGTTTPSAQLHSVSTVGNDAAQFSDNVYYTLAIRRSGSSGNVGLLTGTASSSLALGANNTEMVRIDTAGNVGLGLTSPDVRLSVNGVVHIGNGGNYLYMGGTAGSSGSWGSRHQTSGGNHTINANSFRFDNVGYGSTWAVEFTSGGKTLIGAQTGWAASRLQVGTDSTSLPAAEFNGTGNTNGLSPVYVWNNAESGITYHISFYTDGINNARALRGYIAYRRNTNEMFLYSASDYRIKTVHGPYTKSGEIFDKIKIHDTTIIGQTEGHNPMVLAHELQEAFPNAVDGEKDAVNEDGTPKLQMVSYTAMIPLMLAEIKSLRARVAELEAR